MPDKPGDNRKRWLRHLLATMLASVGCAFFWLCFNGLNRLFVLMEDEGTESWTVNAGPFGILGCVIFLAILLFFAVSLITHAVYMFAPTLKPDTRVEL